LLIDVTVNQKKRIGDDSLSLFATDAADSGGSGMKLFRCTKTAFQEGD
jgi:hypothetical protein